MKRGADRQITKDDVEEKEEGTADGSWKEASASKLAERKFVKVKRRAAPEISAGGATFSFGAKAEEKTEGGFNFDFGAKPAAQTEAKTETKEAPAFNAFAALLDTSEWECEACGVRNKAILTKCASCEKVKAGCEEKEQAADPAGGVTFGFGGGSDAFSSGAAFSFGTAGTPAVTFGTSSADAAAPASGFTFGGAAGGVTFGSVSASGVTFGSATPTKFEAASGFGSPGDNTNDQFKDKKAEASGTEKDSTMHKVQCKVFHLKADEKTGKSKFVECGEGELHVNTVKLEDNNMARVVLRAEKTHRLVLNAPLLKGVKLTPQGEKFVKFASNDLEGKPAVYLLRVKNKTEVAVLMSKLEEAVATLE